MSSIAPATENADRDTTVVYLLTRGKTTLVDAEDVEFLDKYVWRYTSAGYPIANLVDENGKRKTITMQRYLMNPPTDRCVDHINRNKLDNRRCNLRIATVSDNIRNQPVQKGTASGLKGVYKIQHDGSALPWFSAIKTPGQVIRLGRFARAVDAAMCYDRVSKAMFGDFACLNFPEAIHSGNDTV